MSELYHKEQTLLGILRSVREAQAEVSVAVGDGTLDGKDRRVARLLDSICEDLLITVDLLHEARENAKLTV
jgi:hypothetical protein